MTITVSSTDKRDGKALALFARCAEWQQGHTKDGRPFFAIPGSDEHLFHMTDSRECSCADFQRARNLCKHVRAVKLWMAAYRTGAVSPKREASADIADTLAVLLPVGAAYLAEMADRADAALADETAAALASLTRQRQERASLLRLRGYTPDEYEDDAVYRQIVAHIARLEARTTVAA